MSEIDTLYQTYQPFLFSIAYRMLGSVTDAEDAVQDLFLNFTPDLNQINGCGFCLDMHTKDARAIGETEQRIYCLSAWRETPFYSEKERAVLELTEAVTAISEDAVPDGVYENVRTYFDETQYIDLVTMIITINGWNRLALSAQLLPEDYEAQAVK
ncbi:carboxymuconolactone decarboxylase family protein [Alkalihalobacillus oceani]|uniref:carboxymuconolactone decarboxylase family protein n=1 Tax=Halalkalibacter oceani TaxID=1653776 RepID=UPI0020406865|nr:carboxymuconolactone decarboxylase family protein [Halalkalibacter oceani]MCM3760887.1 carboxymuconolactone decarboxylase family protein [Halalkalibacter oceani]